MTGAVPANARRLFGSVNRVGSSPISARMRAARTGPSPGAERRIAACGCWSNSPASSGLELVDGGLHRDDDRRPARPRCARAPLRPRAVGASAGVLQVGEDLLDQRGVVAAAGSGAAADHAAAGQLRRLRPGSAQRPGRSIAALCLRFGNACSACG